MDQCLIIFQILIVGLLYFKYVFYFKSYFNNTSKMIYSFFSSLYKDKQDTNEANIFKLLKALLPVVHKEHRVLTVKKDYVCVCVCDL